VRTVVLGAGSWGTTFAKVLRDAGNEVVLWARRPELADIIDRTGTNPDYLPGIRLPEGIHATHDAAEALAGADLVALAVPAQSLRQNLAAWAPLLPPGATLVSLMKGVELGTTKLMTEVITELTGVSGSHLAVVTGPNLAREIAEEQPTATVVACSDLQRAEQLQLAIAAPYFRPYTIVDVIGAELGGAVKNVIAIGVGIAQGMGLGDNTTASIVTRGLAEMARLGVTLGADPITFSGLAGLGDLVASCASPLARNRTLGEALGRGETLAQALEATHGQVAEGVESCRAIRDLARRHEVDVPITAAVEAVCHLGLSPSAMVAALMRRSVKSEV
jgi:glycerol-3-phosphate dehydrogenase (NAD(P)+)